MTTFVFANNSHSTLAVPIGTSDTTVVLATGGGAAFPTVGGGQVFTVTLTDAATGEINEVMYCTARTVDTLTVERAQEGTTAHTWTTGDFVDHYLTAATAAAFVQAAGGLGSMSEQDSTAVAITGGAISGVELASTRGSSSSRPNPPPFLGCQYFDTDLVQPIWCNEITPSIVWVNAAGVSV